MNEWMTCDYTSFLTVFQSYQDDVGVILKSVCNGRSVEKISPGVRIELGSLDQISKPALNTLSYRGSDFHEGMELRV